MNEVKLPRITSKQIGFFWLVSAIIMIIVAIIFNYTPDLEYRSGMCIVEKDREFPSCSDIKQINFVGKKKVMLRRYERQGDKCGVDWEKHLLNSFYKEVPCSCEGLMSCE
jgi:hypothetical protein